MTTTPHTTDVNGVDVPRVTETLKALKQHPELGEFRFRAANRWLGGPRNQSTIMSFYGAGEEDQTRTEPYEMVNDEPPVLAGTDTGANPVEYLLNALAGCMTTTAVMHAASRGMEIEAMASRLEGEIDVRGFLGLAEDVSKGYRRIRVTFTVRSDADARKLERFMKMSPVYNTIVNPTPVDVEIIRE